MWFGILSAAVVATLALTLGLVIGVEAGQGFTTERVEVVGIPLAVAVILSSVATWQTYSRWKHHIRWRPWLWLTQLMWLGSTGYLVLVGAFLVARVPT